MSPRVPTLLDYDIGPAIDLELYITSIYSPAGKRLVCKREDFTGYTVKRPKFDHYIIQKAREAGAKIIEDSEIVAIEQIHSGIRALTIGDSYKGHLLVGADGVNSRVAHETKIRERWESDRVGLCIAADVPMDSKELKRIVTPPNVDGLAIELYMGMVRWGFGWCFPKQNEVRVGLGCRLDEAHNLRNKWKMFIEMLEKQKQAKFDLTSWSAFRVPFGGMAEKTIARRTMLVGDAAGLASPLTGEGIYYAIESGHIAAEVATEAAEQKSPQHVREYERRIEVAVLRQLKAAQSIANILYRSIKNAALIHDIAMKDPIIRDYMLDFLVGAADYSRLRKATIKRLLTHHPLKAVRLLL